MVMGFDDIFYLIAAAASAASLGNELQGDPVSQLTARTPGGPPAQSSVLPAGPRPGAGPPMGGSSAIVLDDELFTQAARIAAAGGTPPPVVASQGQQTPSAPGTPPPAPPGPPPPTPQPNIGEILAATPGALTNVASLLGIGQDQGRSVPAPIPGGTAGNVVPGFGLPQVPNIGAILSQIPRFL